MIFNRKKKSSATAALIEAAPRKSELEVKLLNEQISDECYTDLAAASGSALTGKRATCNADESLLEISGGEWRSLTGYRAPFTINYSGRLPTSAAQRILQDAGILQLVAADLQESIDYSIIARRLSELCLIPALAVNEVSDQSITVESATTPAPGELEKFLGKSEDTINSPTASQKLLFGETRRLVPRLIDINRPLGVGGSKNSDYKLKSQAAEQLLLSEGIAACADALFKSFGELTGRNYSRAAGYRTEDAEFVIVVTGRVSGEVKEAVDYLRNQQIRAGVVTIALLNPFPVDQLRALLQGKKGVTVLESGEDSLAVLPFLSQAVSGVAASASTSFYSARYGAGLPRFSDIVAAFKKMQSGGSGSNYFLGVSFAASKSTLPQLEILNQNLKSAYPGLDENTLCGDASLEAPGRKKIQISTLSDDAGAATALILSQALHAMSKKRTVVRSSSSARRSAEATSFIIESGAVGDSGSELSGNVCIIIPEGSLLHKPGLLNSMSEDGVVVVQSTRDPKNLFSVLPGELQGVIVKRKLQLLTIDALTLAQNSAAPSGFNKNLQLMALLGAATANLKGFDAAQKGALTAQLKVALNEHFGADNKLSGIAANLIEQGAVEAQLIGGDSLQVGGGSAAAKPTASWELRQAENLDSTLHDPVRFWNTTGYAHESGRSDELFPEPFMATGAVPALSSTARNLAHTRETIPVLIPERCTGCGDCWTHCPDSALPATIQDPLSIIQTGLNRCKQSGHDVSQLGRSAEHLAKQAYRLALGDELKRYNTMGELLVDSFERLLGMMDLKEDKKTGMKNEFQLLLGEVANLPIVKSERYLKAAEQQSKGSGMLLSIVVNPAACKECGLCAEVCDDNAIEFISQTQAALKESIGNYALINELPEVRIDRIGDFISDAEPRSNQSLLLNRRAFQTVAGGDNAQPGSGSKIAIHLVAAAAESEMRQRIDSYAGKLSELETKLAERIQKIVSGAFTINDFETFGQKLKQLEGETPDLEVLGQLFGDSETTIDKSQLEQLTAALEEIKSLRESFGSRQGASMAAIFASSDNSLGGEYPYNTFAFPWLQHSYSDAPRAAEGLLNGLAEQLAEGFKSVRRAELLLSGNFGAAADSKTFQGFNRKSFSDDEAALCPPLFIIGDEQLLEGAALAGIVELMNRNIPVRTIVLTATPRATADSALLALLQSGSRVEQSSIATSGHLLKGLRKSLSEDGPALFRIYAPEPRQSGLSPNQTVNQAGKAVAGRVFPLYSVEPAAQSGQAARLLLNENPDYNLAWASFASSAGIKTGFASQEDGGPSGELLPLEWALGEAQLREGLRLLGSSEVDGATLEISEYLALDKSARIDKKVYCEFKGSRGDVQKLLLTPEVVELIEACETNWAQLQSITERVSLDTEVRAALEKQELAAANNELKNNLADATANLERLQKESDAEYHQRLVRNLIELGGFSGDSTSFREALQRLAAGKDN